MDIKIPGNVSFDDAATIPTVAARGVGLAALRPARMQGAEVYVTVSTEEKAKYLSHTFGLARNRIFNSRDIAFVDGLMNETKGQGWTWY
ncbi:putative polyketide synthase 37 [Colletotrichum chlorophyti]|uniref:Putative polyketide synthase 37 n=1 Tax=Colletotrichum chlorophyti TaxID=708187 RepID=A0A1Q8RWR8_9PEZI|nr:putative polyketide synthase 37 [Colletotrichum chlorophyti]